MGIDGTDIPSVYHKYHLSNHPAALFKGHIILSLRGKVIQYVILVQWYLLQAVAQEITSKIAGMTVEIMHVRYLFNFQLGYFADRILGD